MSKSAKGTRDSNPNGAEGDNARQSSLPWWTWILPLFVAHIGTRLSLWFITDPGVSLWYLPTALGIVMVYWWGPRALLGVYLNAVVCAPLWGLPREWAPLYALPETIEVGLSWLLMVRLMGGQYWLPDLVNVVRFLLFGSLLPSVVANVYLVTQLFLLGDIFPSTIWENWLILFSADLATHFVLAVPVLMLFTKFMSARGWTLIQSEMIPSPPFLPENRRTRMDVLLVLGVMISVLSLVLVAPLGGAWIIYGLLMIVLAIRYGVNAAILGSSWTGLLVFVLPPILTDRLGNPTATYSDFFIVNLEILFLCAVSLLTGRTISDLFNEINERKQIEEALRESEEKYHTLVDSMNEGLGVQDKNGLVTFMNKRACEMLGYELNELIGRPVDFLFDEENREIIREQMVKRREGERQRYEIAWSSKNGEKVDTIITPTPRFDEEGNFVESVAVFTDITERKRIETALQESEKRYRDLVELSPVAMTVEVDGRAVYVNPAGVKLWGANTPDEVLGKSPLDMIHPDYHERIFERRRQIFTTGQPPLPIEVKNTRLDGQLLYTTGTGIPITYEGKPAILSVVLDITQRKQAEEKLRESEDRFRSFMNNSATISWMKDEQGRHVYISESFERQHGVRFEDWQGKTDFELWPRETAEVFWKNDQEVLRAEKPLEVVEETHNPDKSPRFWLNFKFPFQDVSGTRYVGGIGIDITARKRAEEKLERQNRRLKALREIDTAILAADSVENIVGAALTHIRELIDCRRASLSLIDWEASEALVFDVRTVGETSIPKGSRFPLALFQDIVPALSRDQSVIINDLAAFPNPPPSYQTLIEEGFRSRCTLPLMSQGSLIGALGLSSEILGFFDEEKIGLGREVANQVAIAITQNNLLTALRELNAKLEQRVAERTAQLQIANRELEAFSYSVSHDLRAPLRGIDGFSQALARKYSDALGEDGQHYLTRIQENTRRMGQLIDDLLSLSRIARRDLKQESVNLSKLAREIAEELRAQEPERGVEIEIEDLAEVQGDAGLLRIVLQNLLGNAFKFTSTREQAHIAFGTQYQDGEHIFFVRDNGVGFNMAYSKKLFSAFQRLHSMDEFPGTGIGLATVRRIIDRHGGRIWVDAEVDKGAVFHFTLGEKR